MCFHALFEQDLIVAQNYVVLVLPTREVSICPSLESRPWLSSRDRLPQTYVKWISALANVDGELLQALRHIRTGEWSYLTGSPKYAHVLETSAVNLGFPAAWGNPSALPAYGGEAASQTWKQLGVTGRNGIGGIPCSIVHGKVGKMWGLEGSCQANMLLRAAKAFIQALAIYVPVSPCLLIRTSLNDDYIS